MKPGPLGLLAKLAQQALLVKLAPPAQQAKLAQQGPQVKAALRVQQVKLPRQYMHNKENAVTMRLSAH